MFDQVGMLTSADPLSQLLPVRNLQESWMKDPSIFFRQSIYMLFLSNGF